MFRPITKTDLPEGCRQFVELMQQLNFGRIENLQVRNGVPVLNPYPRIVREIKIGGENGPRSEVQRRDFPLKDHVKEFFDHLQALGNGTIESLEVKHGLPFRMLIASEPHSR